MSDFLEVIRCFVGSVYSTMSFMFVPLVVCTLSLAYRRCTYAINIGNCFVLQPKNAVAKKCKKCYCSYLIVSVM